jgi:tetratricopeptide (TPR) repeat protein
MLDWIKKNKTWLFEGIGGAVLLGIFGWLWSGYISPPPNPPSSSIQQTLSGSGDNVAGNKTVTTDNSVRQASFSGDNIARDKIINNYLLGSVDYQQLEAEIKDGEELLAGIPTERADLRLKQSAKLEELRKKLENFKAEVFRLHELFTRIPINTERLRRAKEHFDKGEFREADAVLKAEEIERDVDRLKLEQAAAKDKLAAIEQSLADRANEFLLKAQLSLVTPLAEGEDRFQRTEGYFTQALAAARMAEVLHAYASFLQEHNAFSKAEPLYQEALQQLRSFAEAEPKVFLQYVATALNNLAILHSQMQDSGHALKEFEEALKIRRSLAGTEPTAFLPDVAGTLNNLAVLHEITKDYEQALKEYEEALMLYRSFAEAEPEAFLPYVAATMNNLAMLYKTKQDYDPALKKYEEALKIRRSLAETEPEAFLIDVAMSLISLSMFHLEAMPDKPKSVAYAQEARDILIPLCKEAPHLQGYLDQAERLLAANKAKPSA